MADLGLNVFQVIQNELLSRENNRSTLGTGFRLAILEVKIENDSAASANGRVWKMNHSIRRIKALTPEARSRSEAQRSRLMKVRGGDRARDDKDPTKLIRDEEVWEVHPNFPKTVSAFKELQFYRRFEISGY